MNLHLTGTTNCTHRERNLTCQMSQLIGSFATVRERPLLSNEIESANFRFWPRVCENFLVSFSPRQFRLRT